MAVLPIVNFMQFIWCEVWKREMFVNRSELFYSRPVDNLIPQEFNLLSALPDQVKVSTPDLR